MQGVEAPPPELCLMDESEDKDVNIPSASKVFHSTAHEINKVSRLAVLWVEIELSWKISVLFAVSWTRMSLKWMKMYLVWMRTYCL